MSTRERNRRGSAGSDDASRTNEGSSPPARPRIRRRPEGDSVPSLPPMPAGDAPDDPTTRRVELDRAQRARLAEASALAEATYDAPLRFDGAQDRPPSDPSIEVEVDLAPSDSVLDLSDADLVEETETAPHALAEVELAGLADVDPETTIQDSAKVPRAAGSDPTTLHQMPHRPGGREPPLEATANDDEGPPSMEAPTQLLERSDFVRRSPGRTRGRKSADELARTRVVGEAAEADRTDLARTRPVAPADLPRDLAEDDALPTVEGTPQLVAELERFFGDPSAPDAAAELEASFAGRIDQLVRTVDRRLPQVEGAARVAVLDHLVRWNERDLRRPDLAVRHVAELERLDPQHPVALRRLARVRGVEGDHRGQRAALDAALARAARPDERARLHLELAAIEGETPEALRHWQAAAEEDPRSLAALGGLERLARLLEDHALVRSALERTERLVEGDARVPVLVRLAEVEETRFVRRERATELLESALALSPGHVPALRALERCWQGLHDWPNLVRTLRSRAEVAKDHAARAEVLVAVAEVQESKLDDLDAAAETLRDAAFVQPKSRRVLEELARVHERLGRWDEVASTRERLAELATSKRQAAQALLDLGDLLAQPGRDAALAKAAYEKAALKDTGFAPAWLSLQRLAKATGDTRKVVFALEQRAKHAEGGRARAEALAELGAVHRDVRDEAAAKKAFEAALKADAKNERAAEALLDGYVEAGRHADAAPLAELLVAAAVRDKNGKAALARQRLLTRLYGALGHAERAVGSALVALDRSPDDAGAQGDLVTLGRQSLERPKVLVAAKPAFDRLTTAATHLDDAALVDLAHVERALGDLGGARRALERGVALYGQSRATMELLAEIQLGQGDVEAAFDAKLTLAETSEDPAAGLETLVQAGELAETRLRDRTRARAVYEGVLARDASSARAQDGLRRIYTELGEHEHLARVLELASQTTEDAARRVDVLETLAQLFEGPLGSPLRAAETWRQVLEVDGTRLLAFEGQVRALTAARDWKTLARAYDGMIARARSVDDKGLQHLLHVQSALVRRDRLRDLLGAERDIEAALQLDPDALEPNRMHVELLVLTDQLDRAVDHQRARLAKRPHDATGYAELYELFLRQHAFDKAWCTVNVLACLGTLTPDQRRFHDDYRPVPLREIPGRLTEAAWSSHLLHGDLDHATTRLLTVMTPIVARTRAALGAVGSGEPFHAGHATLAKALLSATHDISEILGVRAPTLVLGDPAAALPLQAAPVALDVLRVGVPALELHADCLAYTVSRRLAECRPELMARAFFPTLPELTAVVATALRVAQVEPVLVAAGGPRLAAADAAAQQFDATFARVASWEERDAVSKLATLVAERGPDLDVGRWARAAELSSARAGLLVAGDLEAARRAIAREPRSAGDPTPTDKLGELFSFAVGDRYAELRGAIGITVDARRA